MSHIDDRARDYWSFCSTYLGQAVGWYQPGEGAGFIGAIVGAMAGVVAKFLYPGNKYEPTGFSCSTSA